MIRVWHLVLACLGTMLVVLGMVYAAGGISKQYERDIEMLREQAKALQAAKMDSSLAAEKFKRLEEISSETKASVQEVNRKLDAVLDELRRRRIP